ncbi:SDR family NAD(P)-dependent oxidoreductase [Aquisediminimonas profunda]|uniref:SDR family NAD(P)-dependent oxidoreductase n=1 Tax=Aquisediminimonas profunda TaxID=1550733 RepID=UPI001C625D39|nr:SDR family oxidoreductase [Aquisediminimonas profunda]
MALITGAGTGVGRSCMKIFAEEGAIVVGVGRTQATLDESVTNARTNGSEAYASVADISDEDACKQLVASVNAQHGPINILVHAAGVGYSWAENSPGSMEDVANTSLDKWREVMRINLEGYFLMSRAVLPGMRGGGGGSIVSVASIAGLAGLPVAHAYAASKAGVINLTRSMCVAYAKDNIRVNCIAPGFINTPMVASIVRLFDDPVAADQMTPMRRPGTPDEVALGCLYFASDESSYCNGSVLTIDGGSSARK